MAVAIRLRRAGAKKRPFYRIVVVESSRKRSGQYIESVGHYNPITDPKELYVDTDRAISWIQKGAQPTATAKSLLSNAGVYTKMRGEGVEESEVEKANQPD